MDFENAQQRTQQGGMGNDDPNGTTGVTEPQGRSEHPAPYQKPYADVNNNSGGHPDVTDPTNQNGDNTGGPNSQATDSGATGGGVAEPADQQYGAGRGRPSGVTPIESHPTDTRSPTEGAAQHGYDRNQEQDTQTNVGQHADQTGGTGTGASAAAPVGTTQAVGVPPQGQQGSVAAGVGAGVNDPSFTGQGGVGNMAPGATPGATYEHNQTHAGVPPPQQGTGVILSGTPATGASGAPGTTQGEGGPGGTTTQKVLGRLQQTVGTAFASDVLKARGIERENAAKQAADVGNRARPGGGTSGY